MTEKIEPEALNSLSKRLREYAGFDPDKVTMHSQAADASKGEEA